MQTENDRLAGLRRAESERRDEERRYRLTMALAFAPAGAAAALAILYVTVPAALAERHAYVAIVRPSLGAFLRETTVVPVAGAALGALLVYSATELFTAPRSRAFQLVALGGLGLLFGLLAPLATALTLPINVFITGAVGSASGGEIVDDLLSAVFGTPGLLFIYWAQALYVGVVFGAVAGLTSFTAMLVVRPGGGTAHHLRPAAVSLVLSAALMALLMAGPFSLYEGLVRQIAGR